MATQYRHTQPGYLTVGSAGAAAGMLVAGLSRGAAAAGLLPAALLLGGVGLVFSRLTVEIADGELRVVFGPGWTARRVRLAEIRSVNAVRNPWWYGWGIRLTPHGTLYNVSGRDAVEVRLRTGKRFRVGTDEPDVLEHALREALEQHSEQGAPAAV
jgi:hypothetical protein